MVLPGVKLETVPFAVEEAALALSVVCVVDPLL
jgi:hypothetical protein